jgi:hypothetical protein
VSRSCAPLFCSHYNHRGGPLFSLPPPHYAGPGATSCPRATPRLARSPPSLPPHDRHPGELPPYCCPLSSDCARAPDVAALVRCEPRVLTVSTLSPVGHRRAAPSHALYVRCGRLLMVSTPSCLPYVVVGHRRVDWIRGQASRVLWLALHGVRPVAL